MRVMQDAELRSMLDADDWHWWYRGRRRVLRAELDRLPLPSDAEILDAGCGSGRTIDELARYGRAVGVDASETAIRTAHSRGRIGVRVGSLEALPFPDDAFDLITCLDVLEHLPDDRAALAELRRVCRPNGWLVVTVPAYPRLWSAHDVANLHFRRYRRRELRAAVAHAGWALERDTHFNALLLAPVAAVRRWPRSRTVAVSDLARTPTALNGLLELPLTLEARFLRRGGRLPAGLSLLAVLRNPSGGGEPQDEPRASGPRLQRELAVHAGSELAPDREA
jgi:SAM-dependent methyltransferase